MPVSRPESRLALWGILGLSLLGYGLLGWWFPLRPNVARVPPADIRTFAPTILAGLLYVLLLVALFALLIMAYRRVREGGLAEQGGGSLLVILAAATLLALPLLAAYPVNATDVYRYVIRGRVASAYGQSPYASPPADFVGDPFMPLAGEWAGETSPYGPLWEVVAAGLTSVSGDNLLLGVWLFKLLALVCFLALTALIWTMLAPGHERPAYTILWAWNPPLLLTFALNGHNDALMLLWLVLGLWIARRGRPAIGFLVMCLAALTKPVAVLALPFFFLAQLQRQRTRRARARFAVIAVGGALALAWLAFLPWAGAGGWLRAPYDLALRLAREATGSAGFSPAVWVYFAAGQRLSIEVIGTVMRWLFVTLALGLVWAGWRGRSAVRSVADVFAGYLAQALSFRIWYTVWPFPWLLLDAGGDATPDETSGRRAAYRLRVGLWFLLNAQLSVVLYGHVRAYAFGGSQIAAHLTGVFFVFVLPWLLALLPLGPMPAARTT